MLILGEAGTGKELTARALQEHSERTAAPLVTVHCAALPKTLQLEELFGSDSQPGRIENADGGTFFLDEVGELSNEAQSRLLTLLEQGEIHRQGSLSPRRVDVRVIASSQMDLPARVTDGRFREDLYYRLNVMELELPPLREREDDIEQLAATLLTRSCEKLSRGALYFTDAALAAMRAYSWPGNVRELENVIERAVILTEEDGIGPAQLGLNPNRTPQRVSRASLDPSEDVSLEDYFTRFVLEPGQHDRDRAGPEAGDQPQKPVGTPATPGHSTPQEHPPVNFSACLCGFNQCGTGPGGVLPQKCYLTTQAGNRCATAPELITVHISSFFYKCLI